MFSTVENVFLKVLLNFKFRDVIWVATSAWKIEGEEYYPNNDSNEFVLSRYLSFTGINVLIPQTSDLLQRQANAIRHYMLTYELMKRFNPRTVKLILDSHEAGEYSFDSLVDFFHNKISMEDLSQMNLQTTNRDFIIARAVDLARARYFLTARKYDELDKSHPTTQNFLQFVSNEFGLVL